MSKGWAGGSTRAYRAFRSTILFRDGGLCQLKLADCAVYADQLHHLDGVNAGKVCPPDRAVAACANCNIKAGDPTTTSPPPNPPRTDWG